PRACPTGGACRTTLARVTSPSELPATSRAGHAEGAAAGPATPATPASGMRRRDLRTHPTVDSAGDDDVSTAVGTPDGDAAGGRKPPEGTDDAGSPPPNRSRRRLLILIGAVVGLL